MNLKKSLGQLINSRRRRVRITQAEAAYRTGVTASAYSAYEADVHVPRVQTLPKIGFALECDVYIVFRPWDNSMDELQVQLPRPPFVTEDYDT